MPITETIAPITLAGRTLFEPVFCGAGGAGAAKGRPHPGQAGAASDT